VLLLGQVRDLGGVQFRGALEFPDSGKPTPRLGRVRLDLVQEIDLVVHQFAPQQDQGPVVGELLQAGVNRGTGGTVAVQHFLLDVSSPGFRFDVLDLGVIPPHGGQVLAHFLNETVQRLPAQMVQGAEDFPNRVETVDLGAAVAGSQGRNQ
jgi:hypothetical protein